MRELTYYEGRVEYTIRLLRLQQLLDGVTPKNVQPMDNNEG